MILAPSVKCPYCQQNIANTSDYFLTKAKYVTFSVSTNNLIPDCSACNSDKLASIFTTYLE